ncbi:MAG: hypothetical protein GY795_37405 [Desulfobacterales bacterium]|nr:hypothetical protein [Desulfobacterales bacterium]
MRTKILSICIAFLVLSVSAAKAFADAGDDWQSALLISSDALVSESIGEKNNQGEADSIDWFKFNVSQYGKTLIEAEAQFKLEVLELYGDPSAIPVCQSGRGESALTISEYLIPGTYYIKATQYITPPDGPYAGTYTLHVTQEQEQQPTDSNENDDTFSTAKSIQMAQEYIGNIGYFNSASIPDSADWFKIDISQYGEVTIKTEAQYKIGSLRLYGDPLSSFIRKDGNDKSVLTVNEYLMPGTYYIEITKFSAPSDESYTGVYTLEATQGQEQQPTDSNENDDTFSTAKLINIDGEYIGNIGYYNSASASDFIDWYKIDVPRYGEIVVEVKAEFELGTVGFYDNPPTNPVRQDGKGKTALKVSRISAPGVYLIKITQYTTPFGGPYNGAYTLYVTATKGINMAHVILPLQICAGNITFSADWTEFDFNGNGRISLEDAVGALQVISEIRDKSTH